MNVAIAATTFALVIPAELPDKTFVSCVILSSRHRPLPVWIGAALALILQAGIAVVAGGLLALLPHRAVQGVVTVLFLGGALYLLFVPEKSAVRRGEQLAEKGELKTSERAIDNATPAPVHDGVHDDDHDGDRDPDAVASPSDLGNLRIVFTTFTIIALAEFGDITQILIANLTARDKDGLAVFVGAAAGFVVVSAIGVAAGRTITKWVPLSLVRRLSGLALLGLGIYSAVTLATG